MKKIISLLLVMAMMAVMVTGCGGNKGTTEGTQTTFQTADSSNMSADVNNDAYVVIVTDSDGAPIVGAAVQLCSDTMCVMEKTDDTGCAIFKQDPGKYTIHILKAEGYVVTDQEYEVPEQYGIVNIALEKE